MALLKRVVLDVVTNDRDRVWIDWHGDSDGGVSSVLRL